MKSLVEFINESVNEDKVDQMIDDIVENLQYYLDETACENNYTKGDKTFTEDIMIGVNSKKYEFVIDEEKNIDKNKFDKIFDPKELCHVEYETFVSDDLEEAIRKSFGLD